MRHAAGGRRSRSTSSALSVPTIRETALFDRGATLKSDRERPEEHYDAAQRTMPVTPSTATRT